MFKSDSLMSKILFGLFAFVIISGGVYVGVTLSVNTGLATELNNYTLGAEINNNSSFKLESTLSSFEVFTKDGNTTISDSLLLAEKSIVGFVENGCEPCLIFLEYLKTADLENNGYSIVLLSSDLEFIPDELKKYAYLISGDVLEQLQIHTSPTIIGIDKSLSIKFVLGGFNKVFDIEYITKYL